MNTVIKVFGCGGGGSNAVNRMLDLNLEGAEFIVANTDQQALNLSAAATRLRLGDKITRGLGAGGDPLKGELAANESANQIAQHLRGAHMVFIAAGMGGGTGTGAAPVVAKLAQEAGALTVGVVTTPFLFESTRRWKNAQSGLEKLAPHCNSLIVVPNEKLIELAGRTATMQESLVVADDMLRQCIEGMSELVLKPGLINVDFSNVRELMQLRGGTVFSVGCGRGGNKACEAIRTAFHNRLLEPDILREARGLLVHFKGSNELTLSEIYQAMDEAHRHLRDDVQIVMGATLDEMMGDRVQVTLVATGLGNYEEEEVNTEVAAPEIVEVLPPAPAPVAPPPEPLPVYQPIYQAPPNYPPRARNEMEIQWEMATQQIASSPKTRQDDLDIPAFLRRRTFARAN